MYSTYIIASNQTIFSIENPKMTKTVSCMVKSLGSQSEGKIWRLSPLDQIITPLYIRSALCMPAAAPTPKDQETLFQSLQLGLQQTLTQIPFLGGVLRKDNDCSGRLQIASGPGILFRLVDLTDDSSLSYRELRDAHFPSHVFNGDVLAPVGPVPENSGSPVMAAQANFVRYGLLLTVCFHHFAVDAAAVGSVLKAWAENTRWNHDTGSELKLVEPFPPELLDRTPLFGSGSQDPKENIRYYPQYKLLSATTPQTPEKSSNQAEPSAPPTIPPIRSAVLYFSASNLSALKALASPTASSDTSYISTNDAFSALLWSSITKARGLASHHKKDPNPPQSRLLFSINCRKLFDPPVPSSYLGNVIIYSSADQPISVLENPSELSTTASAIRKAVTKVSNHHVQGLISLINSLTTPADLQPNMNCFLGPDLAMTSWRDMGVSGLDWGRGIGKVERLRVLATAFDGIILVLPALEDGGLEVFIGLEAEAMERLIKDEDLLRFVEVRDVST